MLRRRLFTDPRSSRLRNVAGACLATSALTLIAACGGSSSPSPTTSATSSPSSASPTAASSSATTIAPTTAPTAAPTATAVAGPAACQSIHLALQAGQSQGAAGSTIATFILRNAGNAACSLFGFPGVSFLNSAGTQVGSAAVRQPGTAVAQFVVQPGQVASFQVQIAFAGCVTSSIQSTTIRVFPPNQTQALEAPASFPICTTPTVTAVRSGIAQ